MQLLVFNEHVRFNPLKPIMILNTTTTTSTTTTIPILLFLILCLLIPSLSRSAECNRTCGATTVSFPFGFSSGCQIPLSCSSSIISIGRFSIRNITADSIVLDLPPSCTRPTALLHQLFGNNYAVTKNNSLLLRSCSSPVVSSCIIPTALLAERFRVGSCGVKSDNISCFSSPSSDASPFLDAGAIGSLKCDFLFGSLEYDSETSEELPSLVFRKLEVGWWLEGDCRCDSNAQCTRLRSPATKGPSFRCRCHEGFQGDGFLDGVGCQRELGATCYPSKYMSGSCGRSSRVGVLIGGIGAGGFIMACITFIFCLIRRRRSSSSRTRRSTRHLLSQASCTVPLYTYKDIERATNAFAESQQLGTGAYGTVYAGTLSNDKLVAIKKIKHRDGDSIEQVMNEIKLLSSVSHPNLVRLLGCCMERGEQILVYEFMANGTLSQHLQRERGPPLPWTIRLSIAIETAKAIAYLHSSIHPPIYHRDIKSSNILLDHNYNSKVADFGLSRIGMTETSHISTAPQGTPGYLDPQYHQNFHLSDKSDVYSFGVVLVEIITAQKAVDFSRVHNEVNLAALAVDKIGKGCVDEIIDPCLDPNRDAWTLSSIHKVAELAFRCLAFHSDARPSMMEVVEELEQVRLSGCVPSEDIFTSPASSLCSSPSNVTDISCAMGRSRGTFKSRSIIVDRLMQGGNVDSPVSVQDPWLSEQSSPSAHSLLGSVRH